eukprot:TRINITY_DN45673_c0_g2_i1.p1 TRINITY_DN45673_c0_g2~~TRINITY_DN45673_c0_g2_i1.p1  ORF type:complete len:441 (+),score=121.55 TRINITY_DN45673_c0_g2_i1:111-1433(+)
MCIRDRHKQMQFDPMSKITSLVQVPISQANARQRRGRAGRTREGQCFKLYSDSEHAAMASHQLPEMQRLPLEALCLTVLVNGVGGSFLPHEFLGSTMSPPKPATVTAALDTLRMLGAVHQDGTASPLGRLIDRIPSSVHVARMLIFGAILGCVDAAAITASFMSQGSSPFSAPRAKRAEADAAKAKLQLACSDHITHVRVFEQWHAAKANGREQDFCAKNWVSSRVLREVDRARGQLLRILTELRFHDGHEQGVFNANRTSVAALQAMLCAGLYPNVAQMKAPKQRYHDTQGGAVASAPQSKELSFFCRTKDTETRGDQRVFMHPSSVNFQTREYSSPWLVYHEKVATSRVFLRDSTMVTPYSLLLFGGEVQTDVRNGTIAIDGWINSRANPKVAVLVRQLRSELDQVLEAPCEDPSMELHGSRVIKEMQSLVLTEGFGE